MEAKEIQDYIVRNITYDVEDDELHSLSYQFKKNTLRQNGWQFSGLTKDGRENEIYTNSEIRDTFCILSNGRSFCFSSNPEVYIYWFSGEVLFAAIIDNFINQNKQRCLNS